MPVIVGLGEALFDVYPNGVKRLGGAPLNFAVHAHQLQSRIGGTGVPVTRIGEDDLGDEITAALGSFSIDVSGVQRDPRRPTGQVLVTFRADDSPQYDILRGVAWDAIDFDETARKLAAQCDAVCFGTLAQRDPHSRGSIQSFLEAAPKALRLCDINLRQNYFDAQLIRRCLELANAAKLNEEELDAIGELLRIAGATAERIDAIIRTFKLDYLILTRGDRGTVICDSNAVYEGDRVDAAANPGADAVGAGDACAAAVAVGLLLQHPPARVATFANRIGAYVASQPGGTPRLPSHLLVKEDSTLPV